VEIFKQDLIVGQGMSEQEATNKANDIQQQLLGTEDLARSFRLSDTNFSFYYLSSTSLDGINTTSSLNSSPLSNLSLSNQIQSLHNAQIAKIVSSNEIREEILKTSPDVNGFKIPERLRQLGVTSQTIENQKNVALQMAQGAIGRTLVANDQFDFASLLKAYGNTTDTQFIYDQTNNLLHPDHVSETLNYSYSKTYGASLDIDLSAYDYQSEATTDADFDSNAILTETKSFDTYNVAGGVSTLGQNEIMPQYQVRMRILKLDTQTNAQSVKVTFQIGISSSYEGNDDDKIL
jgi:hypothetical protein